MTTLAAIVDTSALWQTIAGAFAAGVGTTIAFSIAILGFARFAEAGRAGKGLASALYGAVALLGLLITAGAVVFGLIVMTAK